MWDLPGPGLEPTSSALAGGFLTTALPGKSLFFSLKKINYFLSHRYQCFKSAWMYQVLHEGFHFPYDYPNLQTAQLVYDREVQWTLGAILYKTRFLPLR